MVLEGARRRMNMSVAIRQHRCAIEHQRILTTNDVEIRKRDAGLGHARRQQRVSLRVLVALEGRGVRHQHELRTGLRRCGKRFGKP